MHEIAINNVSFTYGTNEVLRDIVGSVAAAHSGAGDRSGWRSYRTRDDLDRRPGDRSIHFRSGANVLDTETWIAYHYCHGAR